MSKDDRHSLPVHGSAQSPLFPKCALLALLTTVSLAPFWGKAFHVDDPIFLWPAQQIIEGNPKPLSAPANWYGMTSTLAEVTNHTSFVSWMMTPVIRAAGWSEVALHIEFTLFAIGAIIGIFVLARQLGAPPMLTALLVLVSPGFFISATTLMSDVAMLCFWTWSLVVWMWSREADRPWGFVIAGVFITVATLCKYPGAALVPLLAVTMTDRRRWIWQGVGLLIPILALVILQIVSTQQYGRGLISIAMSYAAENSDRLAALPLQVVSGLCFTGGSFPAIAVLWLMIQRRASAAIAGGAVLVLTVLFLFSNALLPLPPGGYPPRMLIAFQEALFCVAGIVLLWMPGQQLRARRDRISLLLALWVWGIFIFATFINWNTNVRSILPMAPALAILAARSIPSINWRIAIPLTASAVLSILVAVSDMQLANASRYAAGEFNRQLRENPTTRWFAGHWGFQWYMQQGGATPIDFKASVLHAGDLVIYPGNNTGCYAMPPDSLKMGPSFSVSTLSWLSTINPWCGANFYSNTFGPLPYVFAPMPLEQFTLYGCVLNILPPPP